MKAIHRSMYLEYKERTRGVGRARSPKVAYAFAAAVTTIPVPAQLVHRILLPDDRSFTFPVPWHFLQLCEEVISLSWTIHMR
jgi:hypothetical protein